MITEKRQRQLTLIAEAIEQYLEPGEIYFLVLGYAGTEKVNLVCNAPYELTDELLKTIIERYRSGKRPQKLPDPDFGQAEED
jgi:hypothetical protein